MEQLSILEFRRDMKRVIRAVQRGKRLIVTYRGKPVMRLEPLQERHVAGDDPFYSIGQLAAAEGQVLTNEEIDQIVYQGSDVR